MSEVTGPDAISSLKRKSKISLNLQALKRFRIWSIEDYR